MTTVILCVQFPLLRYGGHIVKCFTLDKTQLLYHITELLSGEISNCSREWKSDTVSLCPWYLMTFLSFQEEEEDRRNPSQPVLSV